MQFYLGQQLLKVLFSDVPHELFFSRNTWHVTVLFSYTMIRRQRLKLWCRKTQSRVWARSYVNINMFMKFNQLTSNWSVNLFWIHEKVHGKVHRSFFLLRQLPEFWKDYVWCVDSSLFVFWSNKGFAYKRLIKSEKGTIYGKLIISFSVIGFSWHWKTNGFLVCDMHINEFRKKT